MPIDKTCGTCTHGAPIVGEDFLVCLRYPPVVVNTDRGTLRTSRPKVTDGDLCGEWAH